MNRNIDIGKKLKEIQYHEGMKQREFADHLNITQQSLSRYQNGKLSVPLEILIKIAHDPNGYDLNYLVANIGEITRLESAYAIHHQDFKKEQKTIQSLKEENNKLKMQFDELKDRTLDLSADLIKAMKIIKENEDTIEFLIENYSLPKDAIQKNKEDKQNETGDDLTQGEEGRENNMGAG